MYSAKTIGFNSISVMLIWSEDAEKHQRAGWEQKGVGVFQLVVLWELEMGLLEENFCTLLFRLLSVISLRVFLIVPR